MRKNEKFLYVYVCKHVYALPNIRSKQKKSEKYMLFLSKTIDLMRLHGHGP